MSFTVDSKGIILVTDCHCHGKCNTRQVTAKALRAKYQILQLRGAKELNQHKSLDMPLQRCYQSEAPCNRGGYKT